MPLPTGRMTEEQLLRGRVPHIGGVVVSEQLHSLWEEVAPLHRRVEDLGFRKRMYRNLPKPTPFVEYLTDLHSVYAKLEDLIKRHGKAMPVAHPFLHVFARAERIEKDIRTYNLNALAPSEAAEEYVSYLDRLPPALLEIHVFIRYVALLFGGQMIQEVLAKSRERWGLDSKAGNTMYQFEEQADSLRTRYMTALDRWLREIGLSAPGRAAIQHEMTHSFLFAGRLLAAHGGEEDGAEMAKIVEEYKLGLSP
jgi:heme oxygenase